MQHVKQYVKENKQQLLQIFGSIGTDQTIEATKVYSFLQSAFDTQEFKLLKNKQSIFVLDQTEQNVEALIEKYYLSKNQGEGKFYMYRVTFQFPQVIDIVKFWLTFDPSIEVVYKGQIATGNQEQKINSTVNSISETPSQQFNKDKSQQNLKNQQEDEQKSDNQFMPDIADIPQLIKSYKQEIKRCEQKIQIQPLNEIEIKTCQDKIKELQTKILFLEEQLKKNLQKDKQTNKTQQNTSHTEADKNRQNAEDSSSVSPKKSLLSLSPSKIDSTMRIIFQFYAKQLHVTGVKASFQRIQHESSRINYQKLVHFLKEYKIFPQETKDQKKLHHFYVKCSSNTRDLTFEGFLSLLEKLSQIIIPSENQNKSKFELLKFKIIEQRKKNKVLNNPFHSLQKQDFRIDKSSLRYEFKLMPLNGKDPDQIISELQARKQIKQVKKQQKQQQEMGKKIRYIKKLQSIDPFHPLVQKNKHLIRQKSVMESEPVVSMDNIEMYRDRSFDLKMLGIDEEVPKNQSPSNNKGYLPVSNSYLVKNRAKQVEKLQLDKMKSLMSGIIERSNAKLQKMGISPTKKSSIH